MNYRELIEWNLQLQPLTEKGHSYVVPDVNSLIAEPYVHAEIIYGLSKKIATLNPKPDLLIAKERGIIFAGPLSFYLENNRNDDDPEIPLLWARKPGRLMGETRVEKVPGEDGDFLEMQVERTETTLAKLNLDRIANAVIVDDWLGSGGNIIGIVRLAASFNINAYAVCMPTEQSLWGQLIGRNNLIANGIMPDDRILSLHSFETPEPYAQQEFARLASKSRAMFDEGRQADTVRQEFSDTSSDLLSGAGKNQRPEGDAQNSWPMLKPPSS